MESEIEFKEACRLLRALLYGKEVGDAKWEDRIMSFLKSVDQLDFNPEDKEKDFR